MINGLIIKLVKTVCGVCTKSCTFHGISFFFFFLLNTVFTVERCSSCSYIYYTAIWPACYYYYFLYIIGARANRRRVIAFTRTPICHPYSVMSDGRVLPRNSLGVWSITMVLRPPWRIKYNLTRDLCAHRRNIKLKRLARPPRPPRRDGIELACARRIQVYDEPHALFHYKHHCSQST